jgi:hypothetical protein
VANGAASYRLDNNAWQTTTMFKVSPTSNQSYTLFVRTSTGCTATTTNAAAVTVHPLPTGLSLTANPATICNGQSATLTAVATGAASYSIDNNAWQTTTTFNVSPTSNQSYTLFVRTAAGCTASAANAAAVAVRPTFTPGSITTTGQTICSGGTVTQITSSATATGGDGVISYQWRRNGSNISGATAATYTPTAYNTTGGTFTRWAKDNTCNTTLTQSFGQWVLSVNAAPSVPTMRGSSSYCTSGTITATAGSGGNGIKWDNNSTTSLRTVTATGTYRAVTTSAAGCTSSTATITVTIVQKGTSGNAATACGCAPGLTDCSGTCETSCCTYCVSWNTCEGFTEVTTKTADAIGSWGTVSAACSNIGTGWRVPNIVELRCMCQNKTKLPTSISYGVYWSATLTGAAHVKCDFSSNCTFTSGGVNTGGYVKCVK